MRIQESEPQNYDLPPEPMSPEATQVVENEQELLERTASATRKAIEFMRSVEQSSL